MYEDYIIGKNTFFILQETENISKIMTTDGIFRVNKKSLNIIDDSCRFFGSSLEGRKEGTRSLLNISIKPPIIIEETKKIIFFPTSSYYEKKCIWISYNNLKEYHKMGKNTIVKFQDNINYEIPVSYEIIDNQITRCMKLEKKLLKTKEYLNI